MNNWRPQLLASQISLFMLVQLLGLWVGLTIIRTVPLPKMEAGPSVIWFLIIFVIATAGILLALKFLKHKTPFGLLFAFLIFVGSDIVFSTFVPWRALAIVLALSVVAMRFLWPNILTQNIAIIIAIAGVSAQLGALLPIAAIIIILVILSVYDVWAVFKTKHMVHMAKGLIQRGMTPMIISPNSWRDLTQSMKTVTQEKLKTRKRKPSLRYMMLGTGDIAFPLVFAVSALSQSIISAAAVIIGALVGIVVIHFLMISKKFKALPALPPIAAGSIIAFAISLLI
ncbi:hypothetical protein GF374_00240 [Candidatus Woesearchaeota archaeon]|nr:hypothetical protein [Candidatus Woesearchaeota archaeon]